jgi:hypothetical protein
VREVREETLAPEALAASLLALPQDGKSYARVQASDGRILEVARTAGDALTLTSLNPAAPPASVDDREFTQALQSFLAGGTP